MLIDANASVRTLSGSFNSIHVSHAIKLIITQGDQETMAVSASEEKFKEDLKTEVVNNTLRIYSKGNDWHGKDRKYKVYVSFKTLSRLEVSGASDAAAIGLLKLNDFNLNLSGASTIKADLEVSKLAIDMSGASRASLSGTAQSLNLDCSGAADLNAYNLKVSAASATVSGASDVNINVEKEINVSASGASHVTYKGNPSVTNVKSSGASGISKKD